MKNQDLTFSDILLRDMQKDRAVVDEYAIIIHESIKQLFPDDADAWLAVSNLNSSQIDELSKVLLVKNMFLPDTCDFILDFVRNYVKLSVSKNAHGRHDIRDIFQGSLSMNQRTQSRSIGQHINEIFNR